MLDRVKKVAGIGLATSMVLAATANNAQAYDFSFSGFTAGAHSASGTFRISDTATPGAIAASDFEDWEINLVSGTGQPNKTLYGTGGDFGTTNSSFFTSFNNNATFDLSQLSFTSDWGIFDTTDGTVSGFSYGIGQNGDSYSVRNRFIYTDINLSAEPTSSPLSASAVATPVPFGVSTDLSLLILGGLYGASRLRKKLASK